MISPYSVYKGPVSNFQTQNIILLATGTSARCRPDAMNGKFRKVDTHLHGMYYGLYKEIRAQMLGICANYFVGMINQAFMGIK